MLAAQRRLQKGSIALFLVLAAPFLIGMMGYALDVGKWFVVRSELQNAADACALAAAYELDGQADQQARASAAGLNLAQANKVLLQDDAITAGNTVVSFFSNGSGDFVSCDITKPNISNWFLQVIGMGDQTIAASATATNRPGQNTCALPVGVCSASLAGKPKGTWLQGILSPQDAATGDFNWVDLNIGGGAKTLAEILTGDNACFANPPLDTPIGVSGYKASVRDDYNSRFGIFGNSVKGSPVPDISGKAYYTTNWTINTDAYADYQSNPYTPYTDVSGIDFAGKPTIYTAAQLQANGNDRRVAPVPIVDCNDGQKLKGYACVFLLHPVSTKGPLKDFNMYLEYLGNAETDITPCNQSGFAGDGSVNGPRVSTLVR